MSVEELTRDQLISLKQAYMMRLDDEGTFGEVIFDDPERSMSWGDLANAGSIVPDDIIEHEYAGTVFTSDDFQ